MMKTANPEITDRTPLMSLPTVFVDDGVERVVGLLGGTVVLGRAINTPLAAHDMLLRGIPSLALNHLLDGLTVLGKPATVEKALGMSLRTIQRRKESPDSSLNQEQSGRTWAFAEVLAMATEVFGSQAEAEAWIERPAIGLDQRTPIDLLATPIGIEAVKIYLERIDRGVYA